MKRENRARTKHHSFKENRFNFFPQIVIFKIACTRIKRINEKRAKENTMIARRRPFLPHKMRNLLSTARLRKMYKIMRYKKLQNPVIIPLKIFLKKSPKTHLWFILGHFWICLIYTRCALNKCLSSSTATGTRHSLPPVDAIGRSTVTWTEPHGSARNKCALFFFRFKRAGHAHNIKRRPF